MARMDGKYFVHTDRHGDISIIRKRFNSEIKTETVIPDAGSSYEFATELVNLLNSQGSQVGQTAE